MSTKAFRSTMSLWRCAALALVLAAGHVSAQLAREPDNVGDDATSVRPTLGEQSRPGKNPSSMLSVPLTGTGVKASPKSSPKPTSAPDKSKVTSSTTVVKKPTTAKPAGAAASKPNRDAADKKVGTVRPRE
jgi:hypothetical protein